MVLNVFYGLSSNSPPHKLLSSLLCPQFVCRRPRQKQCRLVDLLIFILFELIFSSVEGGIHLTHLPFLHSDSTRWRRSKNFSIYFTLLGFSNLILPLLFYST